MYRKVVLEENFNFWYIYDETLFSLKIIINVKLLWMYIVFTFKIFIGKKNLVLKFFSKFNFWISYVTGKDIRKTIFTNKIIEIWWYNATQYVGKICTNWSFYNIKDSQKSSSCTSTDYILPM